MNIVYLVMEDQSNWRETSSKEDKRFNSYEEAEAHILKRMKNSADLMCDLNLWIKKLYTTKDLEQESDSDD